MATIGNGMISWAKMALCPISATTDLKNIYRFVNGALSLQYAWLTMCTLLLGAAVITKSYRKPALPYAQRSLDTGNNQNPNPNL